MKKVFVAIALFFLPLAVLAQPPQDELDLEGLELPKFWEYDPPSTLEVPENPRTRSKFPFIDAHNHQFQMADQDLNELIVEMDKMNMAVLVNLSGRGFRRVELPDGTFRFGHQDGEYLKKAIDNGRATAPGRFVVFTNVDFSQLGSEGWAEQAVAELAKDVENGAGGLKIYKNLGMGLTDLAGQRVAVDDPRLDPIWAKCGELGIPVLIHSADPAPFWQAKDAHNERFFELIERPRRYHGPDADPSWQQIIDEQHNLFRKHSKTKFINAHLGWLGNDLTRLGKLFDEMPNVYTEIGAVLAELGRQPRFAREFFIKYQDRILFGKDSWTPEEYHVYFRVLETADDYFDYYRRRHAFWKIYGLDLPDEVLKKVYYKNAIAIIPGIDRSFFPD